MGAERTPLDRPGTVAAVLRSVARSVRAVSESPHFEARLVLAHALRTDAAWLLAHGDSRVGAGVVERVDALVRRRAAGEPLAYVLGEAWFFGRRFAVSPDVLVPRPETEHVVEAALDDLRARRSGAGGALRVCDIGTGSGAIAVTLAAELPEALLTASDVSAAALAVAEGNARRFGVAERVRFVHGDLTRPLHPFAPFDCIVANLPYVPTGQVPRRPNAVGFEPRLAVDGGADGLALYRRLLGGLPSIAAPGASAFLEGAPGTLGALAALLSHELPRAHVEIGEDYSGLERWLAISL